MSKSDVLTTNEDWKEKVLTANQQWKEAAMLAEQKRKEAADRNRDKVWRNLLQQVGIVPLNKELILTDCVEVDGVTFKLEGDRHLYVLLKCSSCGATSNFTKTYIAIHWEHDKPKPRGEDMAKLGEVLADPKPCFCRKGLMEVYGDGNSELPANTTRLSTKKVENLLISPQENSGQPTVWMGGENMGAQTVNLSTLQGPPTEKLFDKFIRGLRGY